MMTAFPVTAADEMLTRSNDPRDDGHDLASVLHAHRAALEGLATTLLRDRAAAQDAVSDAIEAMLRMRLRHNDSGRILAYARTAVANRCRSAQRRHAVARRYLIRQPALPSAPSADESVLLADEHRHVVHLLRKLPARQREAVTLRYFAQLSNDDIAENLGVSVSTVRANISRGRAALTHLLEAHPYA
jgi:RNA polymerase sigma factor (sigma-70 family)